MNESHSGKGDEEQCDPESTENLFGDILRDFRLAKGKTLKDVAKGLKISIPYLSDVERGNRHPFSLAQIDAVVRFLGGGEDDIRRLALAKAKQTCQVTLRPKTPCETMLCVALSRAIGTHRLDEKFCKDIEEQLHDRTTGSGHHPPMDQGERGPAGAGRGSTGGTGSQTPAATPRRRKR